MRWFAYQHDVSIRVANGRKHGGMTHQCSQALTEGQVRGDARVQPSEALVDAGIKHALDNELEAFMCRRECVVAHEG